jgi:hypothetical protein
MSDNPIDLRMILSRLEEVRAETLKRLNGLTQEELDWRPGLKHAETGADEWSLGEVFMHIAIDEHHLRENIARPLVEGVKPPESIEFLPPPPPYGLPKDAIVFWFERTRLLTRRWLENWPAKANLELRHHGSFEEAMNGPEWLLGYGGHEAFHQRQIDTLINLYNQRV